MPHTVLPDGDVFINELFMTSEDEDRLALDFGRKEDRTFRVIWENMTVDPGKLVL